MPPVDSGGPGNCYDFPHGGEFFLVCFYVIMSGMLEKTMGSDKISIKGIRQGLLVTLEAGDWESGVRALETHLDANTAFFRGGRLALDVGGQALGRSEIEGLCTLLARHRVELWALISANQDTKEAAQSLGLVIELAPSRPRDSKKPAAVSSNEKAPALSDNSHYTDPTAGIVVRRTLRSGQQLRHPGHIVLIGDVNPGAEIVAGGNIVVWGRARGLVHAGALGDEETVICALDLTPMQLRIAGHIARSPEGRRSKPVPEMALVRDGRIVAVPWS